IQCVMCLAAERIPCRRRPELFHSINLLPELVTALRRNLLTSALAHYAVISYALAGLSHARSRDNQMAKLHRGSSARSQSVRHFWHRGSAALASSTVKPFCISRPNWPVADPTSSDSGSPGKWRAFSVGRPDHFLGHFHPSVISIGIEGSEGSGFGS